MVGPAASIKRSLELLATTHIDAAIIDLNLADGESLPVLEYLTDHRIPFIVQSGKGPPRELLALFSNLSVRLKPNLSCDVVIDLSDLLALSKLDKV